MLKLRDRHFIIKFTNHKIPSLPYFCKNSKDNMKKLIVVSGLMFIALSGAFAQSNITSQEYKTALGVKFYPGAITFKHFLDSKSAVEAIGYFYNHGTRITGLYELHYDISGAPGLKWYIGPGAHLGFYDSKWGGGVSVGVDGVLGLDYKFKGAPINLSLDWQPSFEFGNRRNKGFNGDWGGLAIRYVF